MSEVKCQGHILCPVSNVSHQTDQSFLRYGQNSFWPWKNTSEIFKENNSVLQNCSKIQPGNDHDKGNEAIKVCRDRLSGSHFIVQTSKSLLNHVTAVT